MDDNLDKTSLLKRVIKIAVPASLGAIISFSQETINLIFIGTLNDTVSLAAVGLGNIFINMLGVAIFFGMNGALETLVSQAYGANNQHLCGVYLQRGRIINTLLFMVISIPLIFSGQILASLGQDPKVAQLAQLYIQAYSPGLYLMGLFDLQRRFLIQMGFSHIQMYVTIGGTLIHIFWNYLFVIKLGYGVQGTGFAATITNLLLVLSTILMTSLQKSIKEANQVSIIDPMIRKNFAEYLKLGFPGSIIMLFDWGCYQILSLLSGYLGVKEQACQIMLWNLMSIMWQIPFGIQIASCVIVGQMIGAGDYDAARYQQKFIFVFAMCINVGIMSIYMIFRNSLVGLFTRDQELIDLANISIIFVLTLHFMDFIQTTIFGSIKALGLQHMATYINFISYYILAIPLSYVFAFNKLGISALSGQKGLWIGVLIGMAAHVLQYALVIYGCGSEKRWQTAIDKSYERQHKETKYQQGTQDMKEQAGALDTQVNLNEFDDFELECLPQDDFEDNIRNDQKIPFSSYTNSQMQENDDTQEEEIIDFIIEDNKHAI